jgi:hypothetical protein
MKRIAIARIGVPLGALLLFGVALVLARPAQATSYGCLDPFLAGDLAICDMCESIDCPEGEPCNSESVAKQLYRACKRVGDAQVKCLNRARTKLKRAGKKGCSDFEGVDKSDCLSNLGGELAFLSDVIDAFADDLKAFCEVSTLDWVSEPNLFCEFAAPLCQDD